MIATGSWEQYRPTTSITLETPDSQASSSNSLAAVSSTRSRNAATAREVNTADTVLR